MTLRRSGRLLVVGAGLLGAAVARQAREAGAVVRLVSRTGTDTASPPVDLAQPSGAGQLRAILDHFAPEALVLAHGPARTAACRADPVGAVRAHRTSAEVAVASGVPTVLVSSDAVFPGRKDRYGPHDDRHPVNDYGRAKYAAERIVAGADNVAVLRLSLLYGPQPAGNGAVGFVEQAVRDLQAGRRVTAPIDQFTTPLWVEDAANAVLLLTEHARPDQVVHAAGPCRVSRHAIVRRAVELLGLEDDRVTAVNREASEWADRPPSSCLVDTVGQEFPAAAWRPLSLSDGLSRMLGRA